MKTSQINFVGAVIGQLRTVPQNQLTTEYVASLFADRLEKRYPANFNREAFIAQTGVTPRMIEDAEEMIGEAPELNQTLPIEPARTASGHIRPFASTTGRLTSDRPNPCGGFRL